MRHGTAVGSLSITLWSAVLIDILPAESAFISSNDSGSDTDTTNRIIGGVVGGVTGLILVALLCFWVWRRRRRQNHREELEANKVENDDEPESPKGENAKAQELEPDSRYELQPDGRYEMQPDNERQEMGTFESVELGSSPRHELGPGLTQELGTGLAHELDNENAERYELESPNEVLKEKMLHSQVEDTHQPNERSQSQESLKLKHIPT